MVDLTRPPARPSARPASAAARAVELAVLAVPSLLLGLAAWKAPPGPAKTWLVIGWSVEMVAVIWWTHGQPLGKRSPLFPASIFSLLGAIWFRICPGDDAAQRLSTAVLLLGPVGLMAIEFPRRAGLPRIRRARRLVGRILRRREWPESAAEIRTLPEVRELREVLEADAAPAFALLADPSVPVRVAALSALEFRRLWHPNQAEAVLRLTHPAHDPAVRAAALRALGAVEDQALMRVIEGCLRDPDRQVRKAALEALLARPNRRWIAFRGVIHGVLSDPRFGRDGPINRNLREPLPELALHDLIAWSGESGAASVRATQSLTTHYRRVLRDDPHGAVAGRLRKIMFDDRTPAILRVELAHLMLREGALDRPATRKLLPPGRPTGLRLLAAESLLETDPADSEALRTLREIARQPNRELALAVARIVQHRLKIDMGLPHDQDAPGTHTRLAADVTRRVMAWANSPNLPARSAAGQPDAPPQSPITARPRGGWDW